MSNQLYERLKERAKDNVTDRLKLDALHATLKHFGVLEPYPDMCAEAILRMEAMASEEIQPQDEKIEKLLEMVAYYRKLIE
jgi:hypothetical protein